MKAEQSEYLENKQDIPLSPEQEKCLSPIYGSILVIAGAGTGKTRVLAAKYNQLLSLEIDPNRIVVLTFARNASIEIADRLLHSNWIGTFHKIVLRILKLENIVAADVHIMDESTRRKIFSDLKVDDNFTEFLKTKTLQTSDKFQNLAEKYEALCEKHNIIDFSSMITKYNRACSNPVFAEKVARLFDFIIVDEYQDINEEQYQILKSFMKFHHNIFAVGDPNQAIYEWRGASSYHILNFHKHFSPTTIHYLEENYRSTKEILSIAHHIIKDNTNPYNCNLYSNRSGEKVNIVCIQTNEEEFILDQIKNYSANNKNIAVLCRNNQVMERLFEFLEENSIDCSLFDPSVYFKDDLIVHLRVLLLKDSQYFADFLKYYNIKPPRQVPGFDKILELLPEEIGLNFIEVLKNTKDHRQLVLNICQIAKFPERQITKIGNLLKSYRSLEDMIDNLENFYSRSSIVISTIHAAKGLEFDVVFMPYLLEGIFPAYKCIENNKLEEERRLFYVACTRARHKLLLSYNINKSLVKLKYFGPSRFIFKLPEKSSIFVFFDKITHDKS